MTPSTPTGSGGSRPVPGTGNSTGSRFPLLTGGTGTGTAVGTPFEQEAGNRSAAPQQPPPGQPAVLFRRISRLGTSRPVVHASVDGVLTIWDPGHGRWGWTCGDHGDVYGCEHVDAVVALLHCSVLGDWEST